MKSSVVVRAISEDPRGSTLAIGFRDVASFALQLAGQDAVKDAAPIKEELERAEAIVLVSPRGQIPSISFHHDTSPAVRGMLQALAKQLVMTLPEDGATTWSASERNATGIAAMRYGRLDGMITRTPEKYASIDALGGERLDGEQFVNGNDILELDAAGALLSIHTEDSLIYTRRGAATRAYEGRASFVLDRVSTAPFDAKSVRVDDLVAQTIEERPSDPGLAARRDQRLAQGMTMDDMQAATLHYESGAKLPHNFVVKAAAYLRIHPEQCDLLVQRFEAPATGPKSRGLILDVLSQTGTDAAQAAMRDALSSKAARGKDFGALVQRFSFVMEPTRETADYLRSTYQGLKGGGDRKAMGGAAAALGAVANKLALEGQRGEAEAVGGMLVNELRTAADADAKRGLLTALGNARLPDALDAVRSNSGDADPRVRASVAEALAGYDAPEARATLLDLASDASSTVSASALMALREQPLGNTEWNDLANRVRDGRISAGSDPQLVQLVRVQGGSAGDAGDAILRTVLARSSPSESDLPAMIQNMLATRGG
jgi:hypothetical protein